MRLADLAAIEKRMHEIVKRDLKIEREVWDRDQAVKLFGEIGEAYKVEIINDVILKLLWVIPLFFYMLM